MRGFFYRGGGGVVDERRENLNTTISVHRWRADDGPTLNAGLAAL